MPKFFVEIANGITLKDAQGLWCHGLADARATAIIIAEKVATVNETYRGPRDISVCATQRAPELMQCQYETAPCR